MTDVLTMLPDRFKDERIFLHSMLALEGHFNPAVLKGRQVLPVAFNPAHRSVTFEEVVLECPDRKLQAKGLITMIDSRLIIAGHDDRVYTDTIEVEGFDMRLGDAGKLVTTLDGNVVGIVVAGTRNEDRDTVVHLVPAHAYIELPPQHIREALKGKFNAKALEGYNIVHPDDFEGQYVHIEGMPEQAHMLQRGGSLATIENDKFTGSYVVYSHSHLGPLFAGQQDIGKLVFVRGDISKAYNAPVPQVLGVVAGINERPTANNGTIVQRTYIAPAHTFLLK